MPGVVAAERLGVGAGGHMPIAGGRTIDDAAAAQVRDRHLGYQLASGSEILGWRRRR